MVNLRKKRVILSLTGCFCYMYRDMYRDIYEFTFNVCKFKVYRKGMASSNLDWNPIENINFEAIKYDNFDDLVVNGKLKNIMLHLKFLFKMFHIIIVEEISEKPQLGKVKELQNEDIIPEDDLTKIDEDINVDELVDRANAMIDRLRSEATLSGSGSNASRVKEVNKFLTEVVKPSFNILLCYCLMQLPSDIQKIKDDFLKQLAELSSPSEPDTQEWMAGIKGNCPDIEEVKFVD